MTCSRCGGQNSAQARFCQECGAPLARRCSKCGGALEPTAKFCPNCAHPTGVGPAVPATPAPERFSSPDSYTPRYLAERILHSKKSLEGERKQVTVLFADIKGSLELLADRDPEEARALLDPILERMMEAVHHYEGTVNQVMGDGIMALFGAPLAHEHHAIRACYAALRMQESVKKFLEDAEALPARPEIRVGLNSGDVVVRSIGSDLKMDYSAVGQTTHVASRMEQMAAPGSILMSAATFRLVEGYVKVNPVGTVPVRGLAEPQAVYEVIGAEGARSRLQAAAARGLTKFVGRKSELAELLAALERAASGRGQVVAVIAEAGVGKSRLQWEFLSSRAARDWLILETGCISHRKATAYLPIIGLLRAYFEIDEGDEAAKIHEKVVGKLLSRDLRLEEYLPAYLWLLGLDEDPQWQRFNPEQRRQRAVEGVKRLLLNESHVQPLILVFEDLHWIDAETQALLDVLVDSLAAARILLLVNYRPEFSHRWGGKTYYRHLRLEPLPPETADELLEALLGSNPHLQPLKRLLITSTEGNPFFLEESVRTLLETRVLVGSRGACELSQPVETIQVPPTVHAILASRIDRLSDEERRILQWASVVGTEVPFALLREIADVDEENLRRGLTHLQSAEFLYESRLFPDIEYSFRHALTHDVVYDSVLLDRRRALHGRLVEAIEHLYASRLSDYVERLAHHAFRGQVWTKAPAYLRQAGTKAHGRSANREAVAWLEQALTALAHLPRTRETLELAIDIRLDLRGSLYPLGEFDSILAHMGEAETLARGLDDRRRLGWILVHTGEVLRQTGRFAEARILFDAVAADTDPEIDWALAVFNANYLGSLLTTLGDVRRAVEVLRTASQIAAGAQGAEHEADPAVFSGSQAGSLAGYHAVILSWLTRTFAECGEFAQGLTEGRASLTLAERLDHPYGLAAATFALGHLYAVKGDLPEAIAMLERTLATARQWNVVLYRTQAMRGLGLAYMQSGRLDEGLRLLEQAVSDIEARRLVWQYVTALRSLAEGKLLAGQLEQAATVAARACTLARERAQKGEEAAGLRLLGEIALASGSTDLEQALRDVRDALTLATERGLTPLAARCHLDYGRLLRRLGKREEAEAHLSAALTVFRELGMTFWLEVAQRQALA